MAFFCHGVMSGAISHVGGRPIPPGVVRTWVASISLSVFIVRRADVLVPSARRTRLTSMSPSTVAKVWTRFLRALGCLRKREEKREVKASVVDFAFQMNVTYVGYAVPICSQECAFEIPKERTRDPIPELLRAAGDADARTIFIVESQNQLVALPRPHSEGVAQVAEGCQATQAAPRGRTR